MHRASLQSISDNNNMRLTIVLMLKLRIKANESNKKDNIRLTLVSMYCS